MTLLHSNACINGIDMEVLQKTVNAIKTDPKLGRCRFRASNRWVDGTHNRTAISSFYGAGQEQYHDEPFELHADEPAVLAGSDQFANPVEHLLHALAGCITTSMVAHAAVNGIHIEELESELEGDIDLRGFLGLDKDVPKGYTNIRVRFRVKSDEQNMERFRRLAEYSPVYHTILDGTKVDIEIEPK